MQISGSPNSWFDRARFSWVLGAMLLLVGCQSESPTELEKETLEVRTASVLSSNTGDFRRRSYRKASHPGLASFAESAVAARHAGCDPVEEKEIYRFIAGRDDCLTAMTKDEIEKELGDPFAVNVLRKGVFPDSVDSVDDAIRGASLGFVRDSYVVGEGAQVPLAIAPRTAPRNLRYVIGWGPSAGVQLQSAEVFLSAAPGGHSSFHQVISWDRGSSKYNFYERRAQVGAEEGSTQVWSWAGDSTMARGAETKGRGCFDCHHNGVVIMKELPRPWNNWKSEVAAIPAPVVPEVVAEEVYFGEAKSAAVLERLITGGFQNYYQNWIRARFNNESGVIELTDVDEMLRHLFTNTTVNFRSTEVQSDGAQTSPPNREIDGIPNDFFLWDSVLNTLLGLDYQVPQVKFDRPGYDGFLKKHDFALLQESGVDVVYREEGSTHFSFFVPSPPLEDQYVITQLRLGKIVPDKFIAAVLMVDFVNPVFSTKRTGLFEYAAQVKTGRIEDGVSTVPEEFATLVEAAAASQPACDPSDLSSCTAEQQFLFYWNLPDDRWKPEIETRIQQHLDGIKNLAPEKQLEELMGLSVKRRSQFASWPIIRNLNEFSLLLPKTNL